MNKETSKDLLLLVNMVCFVCLVGFLVGLAKSPLLYLIVLTVWMASIYLWSDEVN